MVDHRQAIGRYRMTLDIKELKLPLQKVIELGAIDRWLRGIAQIAPQPATAETRLAAGRDLPFAAFDAGHPDFNTHHFAVNRGSLVTTEDIERMVGFRQLLNAVSHNNVKLELTLLHDATLAVAFEPEENFAQSHIFGKSYSNVRPAMFGRRAGVKTQTS